jgi:hypothetical protein
VLRVSFALHRFSSGGNAYHLRQGSGFPPDEAGQVAAVGVDVAAGDYRSKIID